jgi:hypothetical protein
MATKPFSSGGQRLRWGGCKLGKQVTEKMLRRGRGFPRLAGWAGLLVLGLTTGSSSLASAAAKPEIGGRTAHRMSGRLPGKPAYLWLWYADGKPLPENPPACGDVKPPPAFTCNYGATIGDCQRQVQSYLDAWYADFNLVFTLTRPASGDYYAIMITSDGSWCPDTSSGTSTEAGVAPFNCNDNPGLAALAFECGHSAQKCATAIAHEHGHLVGLEHTISTTDVMNSTVLTTATGFEDYSDRILDDTYNICNLAKQNSHQQMLTALGSWPGGSKPGPFAALPDAGAADLRTADSGDAPSGGGSVGPTPAGGSGDGGVTIVPGFDAPGLVRPQLPTVDPPDTTAAGSHGGCNLADASASPSATVALLLLALALLARRVGLRCLRRSAARPRRTSSRSP